MRKAFLMLGAGLVACSGGGPVVEPVPVPTRFAAVPDSAVTGAEPRRGFRAWSEDSTLGEILAVAFREAPTLADAEARVAEARARRRDAAWQLVPDVSGSAVYAKHQLSRATTFGAPAPRRFDTWDVGASAAWEIDVFGRLRRQLRARGALLGAAVADRDVVRIGLTAAIASAYITVRELQNRLRVARDNAENQRRSLELTEQRLEGGRGTAFDVQRARAQYATTTATIPGLVAEGSAASAALEALAGRTPGSFSTLLGASGPLPEPGSSLPFGTPASLIARRPDVARAERTLAAAKASASAASAGLLPRLSLGAEVGSTSLDDEGLLGAGNGRYVVGPVLTWPVLSLGRLFAERDAATAQRQQEEAAYRETVLQALQETEAALSRYDGARSALASLQDAASASAEATSLANVRFEEGVTDFLQVLDAQRTQLESEDRLVRGRGDLARAMVELYRSLAAEEGDTSER